MGALFFLRRSPAAQLAKLLSVLFAEFQGGQRLAEVRRLEFRAVIIIIILEIDGNPLCLAKRVEDRLVELENAAHRRLVHHLPFGLLHDGGFVGREIGFEDLVILAPFPALVNQHEDDRVFGISEHDHVLVGIRILVGAASVAMVVLRALLDLSIADLGLRQSRRTQKAGKQRRGENNAFHVCKPPG